jgi:hypothetical protein
VLILPSRTDASRRAWMSFARPHTIARGFRNAPFTWHSCNRQPWFRVISSEPRRNNHANLRENRCDIRCYWRYRGQQHGPRRSVVRLSSSSSLLPSSLLRLSSSLLPSSLLCLLCSLRSRTLLPLRCWRLLTLETEL